MNQVTKIIGISKTLWKGGFMKGTGLTTSTTSKAINVKVQVPSEVKNYELKSQTYKEDPNYSYPEELLCSAHATCICITMSAFLAARKLPEPTLLEVDAKMTLEASRQTGYNITEINLTCNATIPNIDQKTFQEIVAQTEKNCAVSKTMKGNVKITFDAKLNQ